MDTLFKFTGTFRSELSSAMTGTVELELPVKAGTFDSCIKLVYNNGCALECPLAGEYNDQEERYTLQLEANIVQLTPDFGSGDAWAGSHIIAWAGNCIISHPTEVAKLELKCTVTCNGCLEEYANQQGHMDPGGCLYDSDSD